MQINIKKLSLFLIAFAGVLILILVVAGKEQKKAMQAQKELEQQKIADSIPNLPPDPGEAGKATVEGIDSNGNGVRDDVERWIAINVPDSAKHRAALMADAAAMQQALLAQTNEQSIVAATAGIRSIDCYSYLGIRTQDRKWREMLALMLNTEQRLRAHDAHQDRINGQTFAGLASGQERTACRFDVESLPN